MKQTTRFDLDDTSSFSSSASSSTTSSFPVLKRSRKSRMNFFRVDFVLFLLSSIVLFFTLKMASSFSSAWPDPNSPILSKIDFGVPLVELFKWLNVRDTLLGANFKEQDITAALALARECKHPDAVWLTSIFEGKDVSTKEKVREMFLSCKNRALALCLAWYLNVDRFKDLSLLHCAAELENAFACSTLCWKVWQENKEEGFRLAQLAAAQRERDGFWLLGRCFREGIGCEIDLNLAKENHLIAAELGNVFDAEAYGCLLGESVLLAGFGGEEQLCVGLRYFLVIFRNKSRNFSLVLEMQPTCF